MVEIGKRIKYTFPEPVNGKKNEFEGTVVFSGKQNIVAESGEGIKLKITYRNFPNIELLDNGRAV